MMGVFGAQAGGAAPVGVPARAALRRSSRSLVAVTLLAVAAIGLREVVDPDLWWHLATGRYILAEGRIPGYDVFSFTAVGHRWVTHEWLSDLLLYAGNGLVGFVGLAVLFTLVIVAAYALVWLRCRGRPVLAAFSVVLAALASAPTYGVRPQMLSLLFASLYLYILDSGATGRRVWLLPPLTLLWANLHSGFVAGLAILAVYTVGEELAWLGRRAGKGAWLSPRARRLALVLVASLACSLVTPNGISAVLFPFGTLSSRAIQDQIQEWASPNFHESLAWPLGGYWLLLVAALGASRRRVEPTELLLLVGASAAAMYSIRHAQFLSVVGAPILAERLGDLWRAPEQEGRAERPLSPLMEKGLWVVAAGLVALLGVRVSAVARRVPEAERELYPSAALAFMEANGLGGRVFNTYHWGGYLIWRGHPVFIDGRAEVYGDEVLNEYMKAQGVDKDWEEPFQRYGVDVALIQSDSSLAVVMRESERWRAVYEDDLATVLIRASSDGAGG